ncbi:flagellar basal-body rod protein FlgF [Deefgea salmonis]|uniref:Flagellar basal-body rod protein FlgF n=1 Tax=Deefgea salmonis TaxID=2875502 RepID=A0ABS8BJ73_9NEIS|nr:flagellar basal-body rod protein FlgF [Deefgea salmonis]MCB5195759.1 flagellar basal-body rod protein FlgF [Deefgea salmonis]
MDRLIYVAMTGAKQTENRQSTVANNLANANTTGFRADLAAFRAIPVIGGPGLPTRAFAVEQSTGSDLSQGSFQQTGRELDAAISGDGWFAVQSASGEAYTRNGNFVVDASGMLKTYTGLIVEGESGPLTIPENTQASIAADGTVSAIDLANPAQAVEIGRLKLVNPAAAEMEKGLDGLFRRRNGEAGQPDPNVRLSVGGIEGSNVNAVDQLVTMIATQRHYDMQIKLLQTAEQNSRSAASILSLNG